MRNFFVLTVGAIMIVAVARGQTDYLKERNEGFLPLFNGVNLEGWTPDDQGRWKVADSTLTGEAACRLIETVHNGFTDYALRFDWKISTRGRAAVLLRGGNVPGAAVNLADSDEGSGGISAMNIHPSRKMDNPPNEWNRTEIILKGGTIDVKVNDGVVVTKGTITNLPERGNIGFQNVGATLSIRALRVRPLALDIRTFTEKVQPVFKLQCVGCHAAPSSASQRFPLQVPDMGTYTDMQILSDYMEAAKRVKPGSPDDSLLIAKALGRVAHGGGRQFAVDSSEHKGFVSWIKGEAVKK